MDKKETIEQARSEILEAVKIARQDFTQINEAKKKIVELVDVIDQSIAEMNQKLDEATYTALWVARELEDF